MPRIEPDSNDIIVMTMTDGPITHVNSGTSGSTDNWTEYGAPISNAQGLLDIDGSTNALYIPGSVLVSTVRNGAGGSNDTVISPNISLSGWIFMRKYPSVAGEIFNKQYFVNGWSSPFLTFGFQMHTSQDGQVDLYITIAGVL